MDESNGHTSFPYATGHALDRVMAHVARTKYSRHARFEEKGWAGFFPVGKIAASKDESLCVALKSVVADDWVAD